MAGNIPTNGVALLPDALSPQLRGGLLRDFSDQRCERNIAREGLGFEHLPNLIVELIETREAIAFTH